LVPEKVGTEKALLTVAVIGFKKNVNRATTQVMMKTGTYEAHPVR
jgi:hypothetical protein